MPLWGTTHDAIDNKPQFLADDADSDYDVTKSFATNKGWMMRNGAATGNGNTAADDEILVRGKNVFLGYYKDEKATNETLIDGWLHSGDKGQRDQRTYDVVPVFDIPSLTQSLF